MAARALLGEPSLTRADVARLSGWAPDQTHQLWQALGLPPVPDGVCAFSEADVETLRALRVFIEAAQADFDVVLQVDRVIGRAMAHIADAVVTELVEHDDAMPDPDEMARAVEQLGPTMEPFLKHVWRHHLLAALLRHVAASTASTAAHSEAVGFADLVGFTARSQQLEATALTALVARFEAVAYERVVARGGRLVKMIGDEVMFAVGEPTLAADVGLSLVEACAADPDLPDARVGIAFGPTLAWEGDLFGPTVNLASRLATIARPGTVLVSEALGQAVEAAGGFALRHLRPLALKGFGRVRTWVVRRDGQASG